MSTTFNKVINGRQFNFQPLEFGNEAGYHVDVKDEEGIRWEFRMFHTREKDLKLEGEKLPEWILGSETELVNAVNQHE
jgi:hypothetical protein